VWGPRRMIVFIVYKQNSLLGMSLHSEGLLQHLPIEMNDYD
jgi:hypothetical protein